jgi:alpha-1,2-mannosyltransferase
MADRRRVTGTAAIMITAGVAIALAAAAPMVVPWLTNPPDQRMVDLDVYRTGGQSVLTGRPIYDVLTQPPQLLPFTYPPFAALVAVPLAMLPWPVAQWLWTAAVFVALAAAVRYAFRDLLDRAGRWAAPLTGVIVAATAYLVPLVYQIRFGQVGMFLVVACVADCVVRSPRWPRGTLIGLATAIKLVPGVFIIYLWITGRRRAAVTAALAATVVTLATFVVLPGDSADYWFGALLDGERVGANNATTNQSLYGMLLRLYLPGALTLAAWAACWAAVAYVGFRAARRASLAGAELIGVAITGLLSVLLSPVGWIHHLAWLVVVLGVLVGAARDRVRLAVAGAVWLLYAFPVPYWGVAILRHADAPPLRFAGRLVQSSYGIGAVALVVLLGGWLLRRANQGNISVSDRASTERAKPQVATLDS